MPVSIWQPASTITLPHSINHSQATQPLHEFVGCSTPMSALAAPMAKTHESMLYILYFLDFFPRVLLLSVRARTRVQFEGRVNIARQWTQSRVLARVHSATTQGPCCCQQLALLSQLTSLLGHPLPPIQALQYTRPFCDMVWVSRFRLLLLSIGQMLFMDSSIASHARGV